MICLAPSASAAGALVPVPAASDVSSCQYVVLSGAELYPFQMPQQSDLVTIFGYGFTTVLTLWLVAFAVGQVVKAVKNG